MWAKLSNFFSLSFKLCIQHLIMKSSIACLNAAFVVQRSWEFCGEEMWANDRFFDSQERAELYIIQMKPFWDRRERARVISTAEL